MDDVEKFIQNVAYSIEPFRQKLIIVLLLALITASLGVLEPLIFKYFIDELSVNPVRAYKVISVTVGAILSLFVIRELTAGVQNYLMWKIRLRMQTNLQARVIEKLYALPASYHGKEGVGATMTKFDRAISNYVGAFCEIVFHIFPMLCFLIASLVVMFELNWQLSLVVLFFAPLPAAIGFWASKEQTVREKMLLEAWAKIYGRLSETFSSILTVKTFAMEKAEKDMFLAKVVKTNDHVMKGIETDTRIGAFKSITITLARIAAIAFGGYLIVQGKITMGTLLAFLGYIGNLFGPVQGLTNVYQTYRKASISLHILDSIFNAEDTVADQPGAEEIRNGIEEISFDQVSFCYHPGKPVLANLNLTVRKGETVAIVGPSGVGKTTLMSLMLRLLNPTDGVITFNGQDIRKLKQSSIREHVSVVLQDSHLFNDTIRNNIIYGTENASQQEIEQAAILANAHDFIMQFQDGYDTMVGERGNNLSGGQKQRIAIARAILKNPSVLILDEATSALDAETDELVQQAFRQLVRGRTTFVISHRMTNIVDADRIVVLKNGTIERIIQQRETAEKEELYAYN